MKLFCSSDPDDGIIEALNTLENKKIKEKEKIIHLNSKNSSLAEIKHNSKKSSSLLEIIDYPFSYNSRKISEIHIKGESNITDKNGETELMIDYINNYMNKNNLNGNILFKNNILDNYNKQLKLKKENKRYTDSNNNINDDYSDSLIINNDYNCSIISQNNNNGNKKKKYSNKTNIENSPLLNNSKILNIINNIDINNNNNNIIKKRDSLVKNSFLSNKIKKNKKYLQHPSKNDSINNSILCKTNTSKKSIPFNKNNYSKDTDLSKENNNIKKKNESISLFRNYNKEKNTKEIKNNVKEKVKDIPTGKDNKNNYCINNNNINYNINCIQEKNKYLNEKQNNISNYKKFDIINRHIIKSIISNNNNITNRSNKKLKIQKEKIKLFNNKRFNKNISLTNANNSGNNSINFRRCIVDKNKLKININTNCRKENFLKKDFHDIYETNEVLSTNTKDIFNNKNKYIKSNSAKIKNIRDEKKLENNNNSIMHRHTENNVGQKYSIKKRIYNCKKLVNQFFCKTKKNNIKNKDKDKKNNNKLEEKKLLINSCNNRNINNKKEDKNLNKSTQSISNKKLILKNINKSTKNINRQNNNNHNQINQILKNKLNNMQSNKNKIKCVKTMGNSNIEKSHNNSVNVNNKTYNISKLFLTSTKTYNNLFIYIDKDVFNKTKNYIKINNYNATNNNINNNNKNELSLKQKLKINRHNSMNRNDNHSKKIIKTISFDNIKHNENNSIFQKNI